MITSNFSDIWSTGVTQPGTGAHQLQARPQPLRGPPLDRKNRRQVTSQQVASRRQSDTIKAPPAIAVVLLYFREVAPFHTCRGVIPQPVGVAGARPQLGQQD